MSGGADMVANFANFFYRDGSHVSGTVSRGAYWAKMEILSDFDIFAQTLNLHTSK